VAYNATASPGAAALVRPLAVTGILAPSIAAAILPLALLALAPRGRLTRGRSAAGGRVRRMGGRCPDPLNGRVNSPDSHVQEAATTGRLDAGQLGPAGPS
jgi:hypothetical protein